MFPQQLPIAVAAPLVHNDHIEQQPHDGGNGIAAALAIGEQQQHDELDDNNDDNNDNGDGPEGMIRVPMIRRGANNIINIDNMNDNDDDDDNHGHNNNGNGIRQRCARLSRNIVPFITCNGRKKIRFPIILIGIIAIILVSSRSSLAKKYFSGLTTRMTTQHGCVAGTSYDEWMHQCVDCPQNHFCVGNNEASHECPVGSHAPGGTDHCTCSPGRYINATNIVSERHYSNITCVPCPSGYYCTGSDTPPIACGHHSDMDGSSRSLVPNEHWTSSLNRATLFDCSCAAGYYLAPDWTCQICLAGYSCHDGWLHPCTRGHTSDAGATKCHCAAGTYFNDDGADSYERTGSCDQCSANTFCEFNRPQISCPHGSISPPGSTSIDDCQCIEMGTYYRRSISTHERSASVDAARAWSQATCKSCDAGYWCANSSRHQCGVYQSSLPGSWSIHNCSRLSDRLLSMPQLHGSLMEQILALEATITIAVEVNATLCWPRITLDGRRESLVDDSHGEARSPPSLMDEFGRLWDREYFKRRVKIEYGVIMAHSIADQQLCDYAFDQWGTSQVASSCSHRVVGMTCYQLASAIYLIQGPPSMSHLPQYRDAYHAFSTGGYGARMVYIIQRPDREQIATMSHVTILTRSVIRPSSLIYKYVKLSLATIDAQLQVISPLPSLVIGINYPLTNNDCGLIDQIAPRLCNQLQIGCSIAVCILTVTTYGTEIKPFLANDLPCRHVITHKPFPELFIEENALVALWTMTRVHIFAGCGSNMLSIGGIELHANRLAQWQHSHNDNNDINHRIAHSVAINNIGSVHYGATLANECPLQTQKWIDHHHLDVQCLI